MLHVILSALAGIGLLYLAVLLGVIGLVVLLTFDPGY
jgi:hypothetical protein